MRGWLGAGIGRGWHKGARAWSVTWPWNYDCPEKSKRLISTSMLHSIQVLIPG